MNRNFWEISLPYDLKIREKFRIFLHFVPLKMNFERKLISKLIIIVVECNYRKYSHAFQKFTRFPWSRLNFCSFAFFPARLIFCFVFCVLAYHGWHLLPLCSARAVISTIWGSKWTRLCLVLIINCLCFKSISTVSQSREIALL